MKNLQQNHLVTLAKVANSYVKHANSQEMTTIYHTLENYFNVAYVEVWHYNTLQKNYQLIHAMDEDNISLVQSLTQEAISQNKTIFSNHVVSDKRYKQENDNPKNHKIKSMFIAPIFKNNKPLGFLRIFRDIKNKKKFTSSEVKNSLPITNVLSHLLEKKTININAILTENKIKTSPIIKTTVENTKKLKVTTPENIHKEKNTLLEKENISLQEEILKLQEKITQEKTQFELIIKQKETEYEKYKEEFQNHIEDLNGQVYSAHQSRAEQQKSLTLSNSNNSKLLLKIDDLNKRYQFLEKSVTNQQNSSELNDFMKKIYSFYNENEHLVILFELASYLPNNENISKKIEMTLKDLKITPTLLDIWKFDHTKQIEEKISVEVVLKKIQFYCQSIIRQKNNQLKISIKKSTPVSLIFHHKIVEHIITRYILRIQTFLNHNETLFLKVHFDDKKLFISLQFNMEKERNLMNFFKSNKDVIHDSSQLFYKLNSKLLTIINGEISIQHYKNDYTLVLKVPALIIKL